MSSSDVGAGARWSAEIALALSEARIGIICVTGENQQEPWLLFEAGALAKTLADTFVCPYLIQMRPSDLVSGPLTQFQAKVADKEGTFELVSTVNNALGSEALPAERLRRLFERSWPDLEAKLSGLPTAKPGEPIQRDQSEVLSEVLETVRSIARRFPEPKPEPSAQDPAQEERFMMEIQTWNRLRKLGVDVGRGSGDLRRRLRNLSDTELYEVYRASRGPNSGEFSAESFETLFGSHGVLTIAPKGDVPPPLDTPEIDSDCPKRI